MSEQKRARLDVLSQRLSGLAAVVEQRMSGWRQILPRDLVVAADDLLDAVHDGVPQVAEMAAQRDYVELVTREIAQKSANLNRRICNSSSLSAESVFAATYSTSCRADGVEWKSADELLEEIMERAREL